MKTANATLDLAKTINQEFGNLRIVASIPIPFPGTQLFEQIINNSNIRANYSGDLDHDDVFNFTELVKLQTKEYTSLTYEDLVGFVEETKSLIKGSGESTSFFLTNQLN